MKPGIQERQRQAERRQPAAEEHDRSQRRDQDHVRVFGQEEQREGHARIFDVEAGDDLGFAFGHVERRAVGLGHAGDQVHQEQREQRNQFHDEAARSGRACASTMSRQVQALRRHQHAHQREAHGDFVGDDLRRRAHARRGTRTWSSRPSRR